MKSKKFEKVIEWKEKPSRGLIIFGIIFLTLAILNFVVAYSLIYSSIEDLIFLLLINTSIFLFWGVNRLGRGLGEGKKVYYKEMK